MAKLWIFILLASFVQFGFAKSQNASKSESPAAEKPASKPKFVPIDEEEPAEEVEKPKTLNDFPGETYTGTPRLIRQNEITEVFFRDLNNSYVIHNDSRHNRFFKVFEEGASQNRPVSFRADPYSRRITAVDGVDGVTAPAPAATSTGTK